MDQLRAHGSKKIEVLNQLSPQFVHLPQGVEEMGSLWFESAMDGILLFEVNAELSHLLQKVRMEI